MIAKIVQAGVPVLRRVARALEPELILSDRIQTLIEVMRDTMRDAPGVGLAAPQIGEPVQIVVIEDRAEYQQHLDLEDREARGREPVEFHVIINPEMVLEGAPEAEFFEGCLSVRGWVGVVPRARSVTVQALNERAERVTIKATGWHARILQHEIDHLNGTLYIDRVYTRTLMTEESYQYHWAVPDVADVCAELVRGEARTQLDRTTARCRHSSDTSERR